MEGRSLYLWQPLMSVCQQQDYYYFYYFHSTAILPGEPGSAGSLWSSSSTCSRRKLLGISRIGFLWGKRPSCYPTISVKALRKTQSTNANKWDFSDDHNTTKVHIWQLSTHWINIYLVFFTNLLVRTSVTNRHLHNVHNRIIAHRLQWNPVHRACIGANRTHSGSCNQNNTVMFILIWVLTVVFRDPWLAGSPYISSSCFG